ncbi:MAG: RNA methyltransferase [Pseudomonadota bacterium]
MPQRFSKEQRRKLLTVYGRKAVKEALEDPTLDCRALHLAQSNRKSTIVDDIVELAHFREVEVFEHGRDALARISRNKKQDQGVALDIFCPALNTLDDYLTTLASGQASHLIALDGVANPQNFGMSIRSITAAGLNGLLLAARGNPALGSLVIKASAGCAFRAPLLRCQTIVAALDALEKEGFQLYRLSADSAHNLMSDSVKVAPRAVFVLGGETDGLSREVRSRSGSDLSIPMENSVESLNVAVSASLLAFELKRRRDQQA